MGALKDPPEPEPAAAHYDISFQHVDAFVTPARKQVLHRVSGVARGGRILAIMGPTGCGKTSLLNVLSGRFSGDRAGRVLFNGRPGGSYLKSRMAYVTQDDVLPVSLTVQEVIRFHARLRLALSGPAIEAKVDSLIGQLGLTHCRHTVVNPRGGRGCSGGERKRVSIACEMVCSPSILFLDEMTSGLDSCTAHRLMTNLHNLARQDGRTVVCSIHQPSSEIQSLFDDLILMVHGRTAYFGTSDAAPKHFESMGLPCPPLYSASDFYLSVLSDAQADPEPSKPASRCLPELLRCGGSDQGEQQQEAVTLNSVQERIVEQWRACDLAGLDYACKAEQGLGEADRSGEIGFWTQFAVLFERAYLIKRDSVINKENLINYAGMGAIAAALWYGQGYDEKDIFNRASLLFFTTIFFGFNGMFLSAIQFPADRPLLDKERQAGIYPLAAFVLANHTAMLSLFLVWPTIFSMEVYWLTSLNPSIGSFLGFWSVILCTSTVSYTMGCVFGAWIKDLALAFTLQGTYMLTSFLAGGFMITDVPPFISWLKYTAFTSFPYNALLQIEFSDSHVFECAASSSFDECSNSTHITSAQILDAYNVQLTITQNLLVLLGYFVVLAGIAFLGVKRTTPKMQLLYSDVDGGDAVSSSDSTRKTSKPDECGITINMNGAAAGSGSGRTIPKDCTDSAYDI